MGNFFTKRNKYGIIFLGVIIGICSIFWYCNSGFKDLKKNNTDNIFIDENKYDNENNIQDCSIDDNKSSHKNEIKLKDKSVVVEIKGHVNKPDVYILKDDSIVKDLIEMAGGLTEDADVSNINRAKQLQNHDLIYILGKDDINKDNVENDISLSKNSINTQSDKININTANIDALKNLSGIGDSKAKSIIEFRENEGGYTSIDQIKEVHGIGEKMFERIKDKITV